MALTKAIMSPELELIVNVAKEAGAFLKENYESDLVVDELKAHDIKLELDVKTQELITKRILERFPDHATVSYTHLTLPTIYSV